MRVRWRRVALIMTLGTHVGCGSGSQGSALRFDVRYDKALSATPLDGRLLVMLNPDSTPEPRFAAGGLRGGPPFFGVDVEAWKPGTPATVDGQAQGFPLANLAEIPVGDYYVQALLNLYTTFRRSDGAVVKLHMDQWEGQNWRLSPGNLVSEPVKVRLDPRRGGTVNITLTKRLPPIDPPKDTKYIKHLRLKSELVSKFWGRDMYLGASVVLPEGYEEHPNARYPVAYYQEHFAPTLGLAFREAPPDPNAKGGDSARQAMAYGAYREWTRAGFPRFLMVMTQDPNPYYDDGYAVNSANLGPYGDALIQELYPYVEKQFRAIGAPWARTLFGGSTGGWRTLALQIFHPDFFNGAWAFCPDPVDFRYFSLINIYQDSNAYHPNNRWKTNPIRPLVRGIDDQVITTQQEYSQLEATLGSRGRSGQQLDVFQAVFGPRGEDGYTKLLYDKRTGAMDHSVVGYWRDHYDLRYILERDWATLGPKLRGKLHVYIGDMDTFFLDEAARLLQQFLDGAKNPPADATFQWGARQPHCYAGIPEGRSFHTFHLPAMAAHVTKTAPPGADTRSWKY